MTAVLERTHLRTPDEEEYIEVRRRMGWDNPNVPEDPRKTDPAPCKECGEFAVYDSAFWMCDDCYTKLTGNPAETRVGWRSLRERARAGDAEADDQVEWLSAEQFWHKYGMAKPPREERRAWFLAEMYWKTYGVTPPPTEEFDRWFKAERRWLSAQRRIEKEKREQEELRGYRERFRSLVVTRESRMAKPGSAWAMLTPEEQEYTRHLAFRGERTGKNAPVDPRVLKPANCKRCGEPKVTRTGWFWFCEDCYRAMDSLDLPEIEPNADEQDYLDFKLRLDAFDPRWMEPARCTRCGMKAVTGSESTKCIPCQRATMHFSLGGDDHVYPATKEPPACQCSDCGTDVWAKSRTKCLTCYRKAAENARLARMRDITCAMCEVTQHIDPYQMKRGICPSCRRNRKRCRMCKDWFLPTGGQRRCNSCLTTNLGSLRRRYVISVQRRFWKSKGVETRIDITDSECVYCGKPAATADHVVPIVRGGWDCASNLVPSCRRCNAHKHAKLLTEWDETEKVLRGIQSSPIVAAEFLLELLGVERPVLVPIPTDADLMAMYPPKTTEPQQIAA